MADLAFEANHRFKKKGIPDSIKLGHLQNLLHDALIATKHVENAAIIGKDDGAIKAASVGYKLQPDQTRVILDAFKSPRHAREHGIHYNDRQYACVRADNHSVYAKCNKTGLVVVSTTTMLIVATFNEHMYPSVCVESVEKLADYFKEKGK